jgi:hypothetical protein
MEKKSQNMTLRIMWRRILCMALGVLPCVAGAVTVPPANRSDGYVARLLINEAAFPGERGFVSEADSKAAMAQVLWVLESRIRYVPAGYRQREIAMVESSDIIAIITAGGARGQVDGFFRDENGRATTAPRVEERLQRLLAIANRGTPGRFARLIEHGVALARRAVREDDRFARLQRIGEVAVTGRAYSWMTDRDYYHPGGSYVRIPDENEGSLAGNRFFTLKKREKKTR